MLPCDTQVSAISARQIGFLSALDDIVYLAHTFASSDKLAGRVKVTGRLCRIFETVSVGSIMCEPLAGERHFKGSARLAVWLDRT